MRYLIVRPDRLGDMILTLPMAAVLRTYRPGDTIVVLASEYNAMLAELCPDVDEVIIAKHDANTADYTRALRSAEADVAFFPVARFPLAFAGWWSRTPTRVGTTYRWYSFLFNERVADHRKSAEYNEADYNVRMLRAIGIETVAPLPNLRLPEIELRGLPTAYVVLHTPTGGSAPSWGREKFVELAAMLTTETGIDVILTGTPAEREFLFTVAEDVKLRGVNVHIRTNDTLIELAHVLKRARLVVSGSTGPGHIAAALGTRVVGLFPLKKVLSRERWGFRGPHVQNLAPMTSLTSECPNCKVCSCISTIAVDDVLSAVRSVEV